MQNYIKIWFSQKVIVLTLLLLLLLCIQFSSKVLADGESESALITTSPDRVLFNVDNMKPGDWAERSLTIQNRSENDFTYNTEVIFKGGSKKLYNEFLLVVEDARGLLYSGKLSDFNRLEPRALKSLHEEELQFVVSFPTHLGNDFQGLEFEVEFRFVVEGYEIEKPVDPVDPEKDVIQPQRPIDKNDLDKGVKKGQILPSTSTDIFNYIVAGFIILLLGTVLYLYNRRKKVKLE